MKVKKFVCLILFWKLYLISSPSFADVCISCPYGGYANNFVPNEGKLASFDLNNSRYVYVEFLWTQEAKLEYLISHDLTTLEPDVRFFGDYLYTHGIVDVGQFGNGYPSENMVVRHDKFPCPYADASLDDNPDFESIITIGSSCADKFESGVIYYTKTRVTSGEPFGDVEFRFQRGTWQLSPDCVMNVGDYFTGPIYVEIQLMAPLCVFKCCDEYLGQSSSVAIFSEQDPLKVPGCKRWYFNSEENVEPLSCYEVCNNNLDDDYDGLTDCDDPDCSNTAYCGTLIDPPLDPCATTTSGNGYYCGSDDELYNYHGNYDALVYCQNGATISVDFCENGCVENNPTLDAYCLPSACTPVCSPGQTRCSGNNVEICSSDQCSFVYDHTCGSQTCVNGSCITQADPPPNITSVSCTSYQRGDSATCTIYGSNFNCGISSNTFIAGLFGGHVPCSSTQITISGTWDCIEPLGLKQVSHKNPDNQRDDTYNLVNLQMGELQIADVWQDYVHEGAIGVEMGANGCNFGQNVVFYAGFIEVGQSAYLSAENQVLATGNVLGTTANSPVDVCVAKYPNATDPFDKKCWYNYIQINP